MATDSDASLVSPLLPHSFRFEKQVLTFAKRAFPLPSNKAFGLACSDSASPAVERAADSGLHL